jgi:hypothetical protein
MNQLTMRAGRAGEQGGHALIPVLAGAVVIGGLLYSTTVVSNADLRSARWSLDEVRTRYLAQAGVEQAIWRLKDAMKKSGFTDPLSGARQLFAPGGGAYQTYVPWTGQALSAGGKQIGEYTVSMTAADRDNGLDVTITSTGYFPKAPMHLAGGRKVAQSRTVRTTVRLELQPSKVFDYSYFINNWGWFYGDSISAYGNAASNGEFDVANYAPTVTGQPTYDDIAWNGAHADLTGYRDDNKDGNLDGKDGGVFAGWDIVDVANLKGEGGKAKNRHAFQDAVPMPNLTDLTQYETQARSQGSYIKVGATTVSNGVYGDEAGEKQNLYLVGTAANPIEIHGLNVVRSNVIITGVIKGQGSIIAGRNVYVPDNLTYQNAPTSARPADNSEATTEAWLTANRDKDFCGLFARENVVLGDHTSSTWRSYVGGWLAHPMNSSKEDAGEDQVPNTRRGKDGILDTADDDVLEGDGRWTVERYTAQDLALGLIPPGKHVDDPIPGTGEDIDGDGVFDDTLTLADLDFDTALNSTWWGNMPGSVTYDNIANMAMTRVDSVFYTNHAFAWTTLPSTMINVNGAIVSRNESIIYGGPGINMNYDCRLLGGHNGIAGSLLPKTPAPVRTLSWSMLDWDPNLTYSQAP